MQLDSQSFWNGLRYGATFGANLGIKIFLVLICTEPVVMLLTPELRDRVLASFRENGARSVVWYVANSAGQFAVIVAFFVVLFAIMGAAGGVRSPPVPVRFSLRTLLIATTLVAVVLGLIVWTQQAD